MQRAHAPRCQPAGAARPRHVPARRRAGRGARLRQRHGSPTPARDPTPSWSAPRSATCTTRLRIGTAVVPVYTRDPVGHGGVRRLARPARAGPRRARHRRVERDHRRRLGRRAVRAPARRGCARRVTVLRQMLAGERVTFDGPHAAHAGIPARLAAAAAGADLPGRAHAADARAGRRDRRRRHPELHARRGGAAHARARAHGRGARRPRSRRSSRSSAASRPS